MKAATTRSENYDDVPLSALLRAALTTYAGAIDRAQAAIGCDDLPRTGNFIISAMNWSDASLEAVIRWMGVSKQAVGQAVDTLVVRGYLKRSHDTKDRRRVNLCLTERGRAAGAAARAAIERVDQELRKRVGSPRVAEARATLAGLIELGRHHRLAHPTPEGDSW